MTNDWVAMAALIVLAAIGAIWQWRKPLGGPTPNDQPDPEWLDRVREAYRRRQSEASERRRQADEEAKHEIENRPHTDDPVADLRERLDRPAGHARLPRDGAPKSDPGSDSTH